MPSVVAAAHAAPVGDRATARHLITGRLRCAPVPGRSCSAAARPGTRQHSPQNVEVVWGPEEPLRGLLEAQAVLMQALKQVVIAT